MAAITSPAHKVNTSAGSTSFGHALTAPFRAIGRILVAMAEANPRMKQIEKLNALSDEQLAALGTTRVEEVRRIMSGAF